MEAALILLKLLSGLLNQSVLNIYDECDIQNAFYLRASKSITLCDEIVEDMHRFFLSELVQTGLR
ncbi:MAG: hypothetical protein ACI9XK_002582 [Granulosicoccus sp.]